MSWEPFPTDHQRCGRPGTPLGRCCQRSGPTSAVGALLAKRWIHFVTDRKMRRNEAQLPAGQSSWVSAWPAMLFGGKPVGHTAAWRLQSGRAVSSSPASTLGQRSRWPGCVLRQCSSWQIFTKPLLLGKFLTCPLSLKLALNCSGALIQNEKCNGIFIPNWQKLSPLYTAQYTLRSLQDKSAD